jgi:Flp pilus assembly protein TadG
VTSPTMRRGMGRISRHARRGSAGLLLFFLVGLPVLFLAASLAVDFTFQIMAANQVTSIAEAAARAGAFQQLESSNQLSVPESRRSMQETFARARDERVASLVTDLRLVRADVLDGQRTVVTVSYRVPLRSYSNWFVPGGLANTTLSITRQASVCTPGVTSSTDGNCATPYAGR